MMMSGQMWNHIRGPPYANRNPQTGEIVSIPINLYILFVLLYITVDTKLARTLESLVGHCS